MVTVNFTEIVCPHCGTRFCMDEALKELRQGDGGTYWCPNGHRMVSGSSTKKLLDDATATLTETKKELDDLKSENRRLRCEVMKANGTKPKSWLRRLFRS